MFNTSIIISLSAAVLSLLYSLVLYRVIAKKPQGNKKTIDSAKEIQNDAKKFLSQKYSTVFLIATIIFVVLLYCFGWRMAIGFLIGTISSALIGFFGMNLSVRANSRIVEASKKDLPSTFNVAFKSGSAIGLFALGLGLLTVAGLYAIFRDITVLFALALGTSIVSIFSRENGVFLEEKTSAENISKSVNVTSDLFETVVLALAAAMLLAKLTLGDLSNAILFPIVLTSAIVVVNMVSTMFVRFFKNSKDIIRIIRRGAGVSLILSAIAFYFIARWVIKTDIIQSFNGFYGLSILLIFILSLLSTIITVVILEQTAKDASNIVKAVELPNDLRVHTDTLDAVTGTYEKISKYFSIGVAFLLSVAMFAAFGGKIYQVKETLSFDLRDFHVMPGMLLGGIFSYYFFQTLRKAGTKMITIRETIIASLVAILFPVFVGFILGPSTLGGFLVGAIFIGFFPAMFMATSTVNSVFKTISVVALLIAPIIVTANLNVKYRLIISAILVIVIILSTFIFSSKNKNKFVNWLHR